MGLPLSNAGLSVVSLAYAIEELLSCKAKRAKNREAEMLKVEAMTTHVFVCLSCFAC